MAALKKTKQINLLPSVEFKGSIAGRVLSWLLGTFRYIVIITELFVMIAFLSRFWLDAQSNDLNEQIDQKKAILGASAEFEGEFRKAQSQLNIIAQMQEEPITTNLNTTSSLLPSDVRLSSFSIVENEIKAQGVSANERSIAQYIANLESVNDFENVKLTQLGAKPDDPALFEFIIRAKIKTN